MESLNQETSEKKLTPFDFAGAAGHTKEDLFSNYPNATKDYSGFMVNKTFSYYDDCIFYANEMNLYGSMPAQAAFEYYRGSLRSRKRFAKWAKPDNVETIKLVQVHYQCSPREAEEYIELLSKEDIDRMKERQSKGGLGKAPK